MKERKFDSRFAGWTRRPAALVLVLLVLLIVWGLYASMTQITLPSSEPGGDRDTDVFRSVVQRIHAGENYYDAQESEFRDRSYPVRSVLNYRTPTYAWVLGV